MSFLDEVSAKRRKLADVLKDDEYSGIREIMEELYPDRAHFLFELLQNAEDAGATKALFDLQPDRLVFEHNGRAFDEQDVEAITNIGKGTKRDQKDQIGRFGVGFKAVFAYSATPHIWSPTLSFKIVDLVVPIGLSPRPEFGANTRFEFPFDSTKKSARLAFEETKAGLTQLAEMTLLFLPCLELIGWKISSSLAGKLERVSHPNHHVEIIKRTGQASAHAHFLRFDRPARGLEKQKIALAFALQFLPSVEVFDSDRPLAEQMKIVPATPGRVAVFFPAEKEVSGLRFHLHAPFVPELSRASIKDTKANQPLFDQLATLAAASLHQVRKLGLLNTEFLGVLPNDREDIPPRYWDVRETIIREMNQQPLTPTYDRSHAPARQLLQGQAVLKELLTKDDLSFLVRRSGEPLQWAIAAQQKNSNVDRFLAGLAIESWDIEKFVAVLQAKAADGNGERPDPAFLGWLGSKSIEWHQKFYSLLHSYCSWNDGLAREKLGCLRIIRLANGAYGVGQMCYFETSNGGDVDGLARVDPAICTGGTNTRLQDEAKQFLERMGVRTLGEAELIEAILESRYGTCSVRPHPDDLKRFVALVQHDFRRAALFDRFYILRCQDNVWRRPRDVFLDRPFRPTGLQMYYEALEGPRCFPLSESYAHRDVPVDQVVRFAEAVGVRVQLLPTPTSCVNNPDWPQLSAVAGERETSPIDQDYHFAGLLELLKKRSLPLSKFVWDTMRNLPHRYLTATYQRSVKGGARTRPSQLVHQLRKARWIPQGNGDFVRPAEALRELLPRDGFPFDPEWPWIKAIEFGSAAQRKSDEQLQRQKTAKELGFQDCESLERARRFAALPREEQERFLEERDRKACYNLPESQPRNPSRRAELVGQQASQAPQRLFDIRTRSVSLGLVGVKEQAAEYLRQQYTGRDGMICQICKDKMPFDLDDGSAYFEKVEFLEELERRHYQNYLALCPNHAAMFMLANGSTELLRSLTRITGNELPLTLARKSTTIYFTETHLADLRSIVATERTGR